jgi:serine phosphatase RsbU (regulator of sigma subunit)
VLINSKVIGEGDGAAISTTVFDASERRRYERELLAARREQHEIAERLQQSMLTGALPEAPGLEISATYRPAVRGLQVGGDWYDAFWLGEGRLGLVVGDVVGRGIEAAATMGQLRSATRALASTGLSPGRLLDALDGFADRHRVGLMSTIVFAELDLETHALRFACAGHPPPLIVSGGRPAEFVWEGRSAPIDAHRGMRAVRPEAELALAPDALLLLYSDGLVEHRGRSFDQGMDDLLVAVGDLTEETAAQLTERVVRSLEAADRPDDVCVLATVMRGPGAGR